MLYEQWCRVTADRRNEIALRDFGSGRRWTFTELRALGESWPASNGPVMFPQGQSPEFLFALLAAWRMGKVVCPLEPNQPPPSIETAPPNCVHLKTTSGTSGTARFVAFTAEQLAADTENIMATMGLRHEWPNLGVISLAHSYGFSNLALPLLLHGVPLVLAPSPLPEMVRRAAATERDITLASVPAMWRAWHAVGAIPKNTRLAISAGSPLPVRLETDVFEATGIKIHNFYGSSECGGIAYDDSTAPRNDDTYVGTPMKNVSLTVAEDGCLEVRSRAVAQTYWPTSEATLGNGCFHTSDLVELASPHHAPTTQRVFLRGRASDLINVAGRKVSPLAIERSLAIHPNVKECLVFSVPSRDAERTEEIVAVVVSNEAETVLRQFLLDALPAWQVPRHWWHVDALQSNARGKISRAEWRQRFLNGRNPTA